MTESGQAAAAR
jgi:hypothetical protein